ncbi:MAG: HDOD domain-containing protein [Sulfuriferula sp.]|nr:HDOD domain-containing protein [Sulfuriferula sp.]
MTDTVEITEALSRLHQLPVISAVMQEVIGSFSNPLLDNTTLARKIEQDQGLTAKILRVANSAFYGLPREIGSMQDAVVVLGFNNLRSLILSAGFVKAFADKGGSRFDYHAYWKRSFRVAAYTKALAGYLKFDHQDLAFTAGMFHDIGQLVMDTCMREQFQHVLELQSQSGQELVAIEQAVLGYDHARIGAEVARMWNFPRPIEHAIRYWRAPYQDPFEPLTGMVHIAVLIASGLNCDELGRLVSDDLRAHLNIDWHEIATALPDHDEVEAGANLLLSL